ncbi:restriction endonuclease subunit S [Martelella sp. FOR1707]
MIVGNEVAENLHIPDGWQERRFKMLVERFYSGGTPATGNDLFWGGDIPWVSPKDMKFSRISLSEDNVTALALEETNLSLLEPGHVLMVVRSGILRHTIPVAINSVPVTVNQDIKAMRLCPVVDSDFFRYYVEGLQSDLLHLWRKPGTTVESLEYDYYSEHLIPVPPLATQKRITRFLDEKTARIDGLIEKKRALLDRLAEKRQALITRAVTKGLNPGAPMKPSGIDWLGDIPAHWQIKRLSFVANVIDCKHRTPEYVDDGIPLVSTTEVKPFRIDYATKRMVSDDEFALMSDGGRKPHLGDIIYSRNASVGSAALVKTAVPLCLGQDLCLIRPKEINPAFLEFFLNSRACLEQLDRELVGATFKRVNVDAIKKYFTILPPAAEQDEIVAGLNERLAKDEACSSDVERSLDLLVEYRAAIIAAAVTGQMADLA